MSRRRPQLAFESISLEGGLLSADFLAQVASLEAGQQTADAYQLPRGLQIRDEIGRAWRIAEAHWRDVGAAETHADGRDRAVMAMLTEAFGWDSLIRLTSPVIVEDRSFPLTAVGVGGRVPLVVAPGQQDLDAGDVRFGDGTKRRSAFGLVQEYLNAQQSALWGVATNGQVLRLVRDNASLTRPAWIEVDLARIFAEQRYADFSLLWLLLHESRFGTADAPPHEAILEQWRGKSLESGTAARDRLRDGVEEALRALGNGFLAHPGNAVLREALTSGALDAAGYEQQLLRLVYRLIFLLVAEERELLHPPSSEEDALATYRDGYSLRRLRERAVRRRSHDRHDDAWDGLQQTFRGCAAGEPRLALPGLGGLFEASQCPDLEGVRLANHALLQAVFRLTWLTEGNALVRVNWRDMGTEELGSVYESLLELVPEVHDGAQRFGFLGDPDPNAPLAVVVAGHGTARKLTGSYYTPDSLVQALLDSALDPLVDRALTADDPQHALLSLSILDPAMGSGHFLLGAARRIAGHLAKLRSDGTPGPQAFRSALREVISRCCYGVDKNPMAVELARIALWLEAMEPGKPLAFLRHHLVHGDGILGIHDPAVLAEGIPDEAFTPLTGDDRAAAKALKASNSQQRKALERERAGGQIALTFDQSAWTAKLTALEAMPDGTLAEIAAKEAALADARAAQDADFRFACDAYVAAFILRKDDRTRQHFPTTGTLRNLGVGVAVPEAVRIMVAEVAAAVPFLHWPITFAPIMARGGFDCVVGNPPWEKLKVSEKEFFGVRAPQIAAAQNASVREQMIAALGRELVGTPDRRLFDDFERAKQEAEGASKYAREGRRFPLTGSGDVNLYALFAEVGLQLVHRDGRAGLVLPSGIASDAGTAPFFRHVADGRLASLIDFENRGKLFAAVDSRMKFCLLTIGRTAEPLFAFFLTQPEERFDERRCFTLTAADLKRLNPNTGTAPTFRSNADAELAAKIYRNVPVLWDESREDGNAWGVAFGTMFHMSNDSGLFVRAPGAGLVPLYEAKMIHQYDHRHGSFETRDEERGYRVLPETPLSRYQDQDYAVTPFYWVSQSEVENRLLPQWNADWLIAFKDITAPTNERTVIASFIPRSGVGHTAPLLFLGHALPAGRAVSSAVMLAILNSLVFDFVARLKVSGLHLTYTYLKQLAVPAPNQWTHEEVAAIVQRVAELSCTSTQMNGLRRDLEAEMSSVGVVDFEVSFPAGRWNPERRCLLRAEVDALVAHRFGLSKEELMYVLSPQDVLGQDYPSETFRILRDKEVQAFGEYRTKRLVLEAWDRLIGTA